MLPRDPAYHVEPFTFSTDREFGVRVSAASPESSSTPYDSMSTSQPMSTGHTRSHSIAPSMGSPTSAVPPGISPPRTIAEEPRSQVYVVHHDAGRPPVTVYAADGTEVVELPPRYTDSGTGSASGSGSGSSTTAARPRPLPPLRLHESRQPSALPEKSEPSGSMSR